MENLTLLEQEVLEILKQLEFSCDQFDLNGEKRENRSSQLRRALDIHTGCFQESVVVVI